MTRGKQSVKKGIWHLRGRRQQGKGFPRGLLASAAAPLLGEIAKPLFKIIFGRRKTKRR